MPKTITHSDIKSDAKSHIPGGLPSVAASAIVQPQTVETPRKEVTPRTDPGNQDKYQRGAKRVWNKVRPKASRKYR